MTWRGCAVAGMLLVMGLGGCAPQNGHVAAEAPAAGATIASPEGAMLAYEHTLNIKLEAEKIGPRVKQIAEACQSARFGDCAVLQVEQEGGEYPSGSVRFRVAPKGVEPLISLAGEGGEIASRNTQAEDLAQQVADTALTKARLQKEHERLQAYQEGKDVKMADLLVIAQRLSEIEAGVEQANKDAANQRRRIDTQLMTVRFNTPSGERNRSAIGEAFGDAGMIFTESIAFLIRAVAALVPVAVVGGVFVWGVLALWRRRRRARVAAGQ